MDRQPEPDKGDQGAGPGQFQFSEENVKRLKEKYMEEMRRESAGGDKADEENPMRACMRIMFEAANERDARKRGELACELSKLLTRPAGLINLFLALIDFDTSSQKTTTHNQRFIAVANIIAHLPKLALPYVDYCDNLRRQLKLILVHTDTRYSSLASLIIKALLESPHANKSRQQVQELLLKPFIEPLTQGEAEKLKPHHAIMAIHNLIQNQVPTRLFAHVFPNLFYALVTLNETPSQFKGYLRTTLATILDDLQPGPACCLLEQTLFHHQDDCGLYEVATESDQITLVLSDKSTRQTLDFTAMRDVAFVLLKDCDSELLVLEFFFHFQAKMWTCGDRETSVKCVALIEPLLEQTIAENQTDNKLDLLASIISNGPRALELIARTLLNYLEVLRLHRHDTEQDMEEWQNLVSPSLNTCLDILEVLFNTGGGGSSSVSILREKIANTLQEIGKLMCEHKDSRLFNKQLRQNLESLIERLADESDQFRVPKVASIASREYDAAMRDLNDQLVPVRVHALVRLKNLVLARDQYTCSRIPQLYSMVECSLADQEPYVFLASINLLAEMGLRKTDELLGKLMELYSAKRELDVQQRLNVGEVLVRLVRRLHQMTPHYAQSIMGAFLEATRSSEELVRVSSLANIGELCRNLGDSLGKYMVEILHRVEQILREDSLQAKCAAVGLMRAALMGLEGPEMVESIQCELNSIYTLLKRLRQQTLDETLCLQADLALDEIDRLARAMLAPGANDRLVKNIKVLSLLD